MSLSKRLYESGFVGEIECKYPLLEVGQRFTVNFGYQKNLVGTWEIVSNEQSPLYLCNRVLKNGNLSRSRSLDNYRRINESVIYRALDQKEI